MRLRYQLAVAALVITLMISSFLVGRQFESVAAVLSGGGRDTAALISAVLSMRAEADGRGGGDEASLRPLEGFQEVLNHLRRDYVSPVKDEDKLTYGAIRGMLAVLREEPHNDRYSRFLDPEEYRSFLKENEGHFGGIGAEIGVREVTIKPAPEAAKAAGVQCPVCGTDIANPRGFQIVVIAPLPDSPAQRAGVRAGDHILRVDGVPTVALALADAVRRIKGPPGTAVELVIGREGLAEPRTIKVTRAVIDVRSVEHRILADKIGYLRITTFNDTTPDLVRESLRQLRAAGIRGLLLDLRDDSGGGLDVCVEVSSQFVGDRPIVYIQERGQERKPRAATRDARRMDIPLVVLINKSTASAAEILAGAVQDYGIGKLVGEGTFGKGLVQTVFPLRDGSALALTTARYLTPKLRDIDHKGISPDVEVKQSESAEYIPPLSKNDTQGAAGLAVLQQELRGAVRAAA